MATISDIKLVQSTSIVKIDHDKVESARVKRSPDGNDVVLDLPQDTMEADQLPAVTIVTVTRNRKKFFSLAIDNWQRVYYPHNKIFWLVVDDSDTLKDGPVEQLKALKDSRVKYYYLAPKENDGVKTGHTVGYKRNLSMGLVDTEIVCMCDDDDYFYNESILARVCCLTFYGKQCVYSAELGIYNIHHESSYILEGFDDVPEGSILLTKKFWERQKFGESPRGEGAQLVSGQELDLIKIPYYFNMIVLNHATNTTGKGRNMRFEMTGKLKQKASTSAPINFYKLFPKSFKDALKSLSVSET